MEPDFIAAHKFSSKHKDLVMQSDKCGCFYCLAIFSSNEISEWIDEENTALCPKCDIDSVLPSVAGYPLVKDFLKQMNEYWFGSSFDT